MAMPRMVEQWTREKVLALPDDGMRHELIDGMHIVSPAPRLRHQRVVFEFAFFLTPYVRASGLADLLSLPGDLALGEDEVLQPDLYVWPTGAQPAEDWLDITSLLLVVEVLSPSTARNDRGIKRHRYQRARIPEYWIVDMDARVVERWRPDDARPEIISDALEWRLAPEMEPLTLDLTTLFMKALGTP